MICRGQIAVLLKTEYYILIFILFFVQITNGKNFFKIILIYYFLHKLKHTLFVITTKFLADDDNPITSNFKCRLNGCCDQHEWCRFWASMGECFSNKNWMNRNCQLACNSCTRRKYLFFNITIKIFIKKKLMFLI